MTTTHPTLVDALREHDRRQQLVAQCLADLVDSGTELLERVEDRGVDTVAGLAEAVDGLLGFVRRATDLASSALESWELGHDDSPSSVGSTPEGRCGGGAAATAAPDQCACHLDLGCQVHDAAGGDL